MISPYRLPIADLPTTPSFTLPRGSCSDVRRATFHAPCSPRVDRSLCYLTLVTSLLWPSASPSLRQTGYRALRGVVTIGGRLPQEHRFPCVGECLSKAPDPRGCSFPFLLTDPAVERRARPTARDN
jgi:hypothetical protein